LKTDLLYFAVTLSVLLRINIVSGKNYRENQNTVLLAIIFYIENPAV
jgi:hypothetical protein